MANSTVLVAAPPRETPFFDPRSGRISEPWLAWFGSITSTATVVQYLQQLQIVAEDNATDGNSAAILAAILDAVELLAEPRRIPDPVELPAESTARDWSAEIAELRALTTAAVESANAWRAEVQELRAMLATADVFPGAQVASMISQAAASTGNLTESTSDVLSITGGAGAVVGSGTSIRVLQASSSQDGYLAKGDWSTFNAKQNALGYTPLNPANNLSDVTAAATARGNLGLGFGWTAFTPTIVSGNGSGLTVDHAYYFSVGNVCFIRIAVRLTTTSTGGSSVTLSLPVNAAASEDALGGFCYGYTSGGQILSYAWTQAPNLQVSCPGFNANPGSWGIFLTGVYGT